MTMRKTPNLRLRYPWASDVASAGDVQSMASDIDQSFVQTQKMASDFSKMASVVVTRAAVQSIVKGTVTAVTFDTVALNNGANSPQANGAWYSAAAPTRLTAPVPCVVLVSGSAGMNFTTALGTAGCLQVSVGINGGTGSPNVQGNKYSPFSTATGQQWTTGISMWKMVAGDYLSLFVYWTGTPAGPFNTDTVYPPSLSLVMVALPTVP